MKTNKSFIILFTFLSLTLLLTGCSKLYKNNHIKVNGDSIIIEQRIDEKDEYEFFKEINESENVQKVKDILEDITWVHATVDMAYPPHYRFHFENSKKETVDFRYDLWISPNRDKIELNIDSEDKYIQLEEEKSSELFKLLTGKELE